MPLPPLLSLSWFEPPPTTPLQQLPPMPQPWQQQAHAQQPLPSPPAPAPEPAAPTHELQHLLALLSGLTAGQQQACQQQQQMAAAGRPEAPALSTVHAAFLAAASQQLAQQPTDLLLMNLVQRVFELPPHECQAQLQQLLSVLSPPA